jgi:hypothetical protein
MATTNSIDNKITSGDFTIEDGNLLIPTSSASVGLILGRNGASPVFLIHFFTQAGATYNNIFMGILAGNSSTTGIGANVGLGYQSLTFLSSGYFNSTIGSVCAQNFTSGKYNCFIGRRAGLNFTTGSNSSYFGSNVANQATSSNSYNLCLGCWDGSLNTGASGISTTVSGPHGNIHIMNAGASGDVHIIKIGRQGTSTGQINKFFLAGAYAASVGATAQVVLADNVHQIGGLVSTVNYSLSVGGTKQAYTASSYPNSTAQGDLIVASASNTVASLAKDTNATRYLSNTGTSNNAAWAQVALTTGVSGILPNANGGELKWNNVTGTTQTAVVNQGYTTNNASLVTVTLPASATVGARVAITGSGAGGWRLAQNASQLVYWLANATTTGTGGRVDSAAVNDAVEVQCVITDTTWVIIRHVGSITLT